MGAGTWTETLDAFSLLASLLQFSPAPQSSSREPHTRPVKLFVAGIAA
jgi:hypothetical protein